MSSVPGQTSESLAFTCPRCGARSYHPRDLAESYCGRCHWWTGDPQLGAIEPPR